MIVGFLAFLCLAPLAWTSTDASVRRLGFQRWKALHRLAYVAGVLAVVHFTCSRSQRVSSARTRRSK